MFTHVTDTASPSGMRAASVRARHPVECAACRPSSMREVHPGQPAFYIRFFIAFRDDGSTLKQQLHTKNAPPVLERLYLDAASPSEKQRIENVSACCILTVPVLVSHHNRLHTVASLSSWHLALGHHRGASRNWSKRHDRNCFFCFVWRMFLELVCFCADVPWTGSSQLPTRAWASQAVGRPWSKTQACIGRGVSYTLGLNSSWKPTIWVKIITNIRFHEFKNTSCCDLSGRKMNFTDIENFGWCRDRNARHIKPARM